jgi:hypothetical protein
LKTQYVIYMSMDPLGKIIHILDVYVDVYSYGPEGGKHMLKHMTHYINTGKRIQVV